MIFVLYLLLGWISGYREIQILIEKKSWTALSTWLPMWKINSKTLLKNFDSFHFMIGAFILVMVITNELDLQWKWFTVHDDTWDLLLHAVGYWAFIFWQRNIMMHIIGMTRGYRRWKYLSPTNF